MYGLLAPAINFMNRLSYAKKFGVISLTFFIPLVLLSYAILDQTYQHIKKSKTEKNSIQVIEDVLVMLDYANLYRDFATVEIIFPNSELTAKTNKVESQLVEALDNLKLNYPSGVVAQDIENKLDDWKDKLRRGAGNNQPTVKDQYKSYDLVVQDLLFLAIKSAQISGISQDTNQDVQLLLNLMLTDYPSYHSALGLAHSVGVYSIHQKNIAAATYDLLNDTYDDVDLVSKNMAKNHNALLKGNVLFRSFKEAFINIEQEAEAIRFKLDEDIISAVTLDIGWQGYSDFYIEKVGSLKKVRDIAIPSLNDILQKRIDELTQRFVIVLVAISLVMLLIVYLYAAFFWSVRSTVGHFFDAAQEISNGDMRVRVEVESKDEMGELTSEFNVMVEKIHTLLQAVHKTSSDVGLAMDQVGTNAEQSNRAASEQLKQTEQVASAVTQMSASAGEVNRQSKEAADSASKATNQAGAASTVVDETLSQINSLADEIMQSTDVINQLSENSSNIGSMLAVIKGIAEQTNLLALNAAIEAARAGEQGRGFAVVADEVRTLASRTQRSAQEIEEVMTSLHSGISNAVDVMGNSHKMAQETVESSSKVGSALEVIVEMVDAISAINSQISSSADEQTQVAQAIDSNVIKINELGRATVVDAEHTVKAIKEVTALTESLQEKLERFQV
ncbi:MAG: methyl-accepting chemotaxis protein [Bermanella sp.]